jgi:hypothetical protein
LDLGYSDISRFHFGESSVLCHRHPNSRARLLIEGFTMRTYSDQNPRVLTSLCSILIPSDKPGPRPHSIGSVGSSFMVSPRSGIFEGASYRIIRVRDRK